MKMSLPEQNTEEWKLWRQNKIGASDVPIILGVSPYSTALQLWKRKLGFTAEIVQHAGMRKGHEMESHIRGLANSHLDSHFEPLTIQHPQHEWAIASLDGASDDKRFVIEIKYANKDDHAGARKGIIPEKYMPQVQWQMFIYKALFEEFESLYYCSWNNNDFVCFEIPFQDDFINKCFYECEQFFNCLDTYTPPAPSNKDHIDIDDDEFGKAAIEWIQAKTTFDEAKKQEAYYKKKLISFTDDGNCEGYGVRLTRVEQKGNIDWDRVCADFEIDKTALDKYRKEQVGFWRIAVTDNNVV